MRPGIWMRIGLCAAGLLLVQAAQAQVPAFVWERPSTAAVPPGAQGDLIRTGEEIFARTYAFFGPFAEGPDAGYAGNNLACGNCHIDLGRRKFAFLLVGAANTYPRAMRPGGPLVTLDERLNQCMTRSLAGRAVPTDLPAFGALRAYVAFLSAAIPKDVQVEGSGRVPIGDPAQPPDISRGATLFAAQCSECHRADGPGAWRGGARSAFGYAYPPLWGKDSFAADAGLADLKTFAGFVHANMPDGVDWLHPKLTGQQAYDVGWFVLSHPRPAGSSTAKAHLNDPD